MTTSPRTTIGVATLFVFSLATLVLTSGCNESATGTTQQAKSVPEDDPAPVAKSPGKAAASTPALTASLPASAAKGDERFQVPDGSADQVLSFINSLATPEQFASDAEAMDYRRKAAMAIGVAADKVLAGDATEPQLGEAIQWKLESLRIADALAGTQTTDASDKFVEKLLQHDRLEVKRAAQRVQLDRRLRKWKTQTAEERLATIQSYVDSLKKNGLTKDDARLLSSLSNILSLEIFSTSDAAAAPYRDVVALLKESSDPELAKLVREFEGTVRRLELPGKKLALEGKLLDGAPFDWNAYRGKVVLVDFWATDCEDCMLETPNLARHLRMYRDKGFDIVGVNLNRDATEVARVAKEAGITWPSLFEVHSEDERWAHPVADNLSINAIPQLILVDKEGTVVHMSAGGSKLTEELRKLLGEPAAPADDFTQAGVPDGSPAEILSFVENTIRAMPQPRTQQEQMQNREKFRVLLGAAIEKVLAGKPTYDQTGEVIQMKIATLRMMNLGADEGERELGQFLDRLAAHEHRPVAAAAAEINLLRVVEDWEKTPSAKRSEVIGRYVELASESGPTMNHVAVLEKLATMSGLTGDEKLAAKAVSGVLPLYASKSTPQIAKAAEVLEGTLRRLNLPGNPLELEGTFMDGKPLDWASYRGKVVLVDFWASWCGPCRQEIPNIKRNLEAFKSKGFEVIGVCVDDDRAPAEAYLKEAGVPWPSLIGTKAGETGFDHPVAQKYGLTGIPLAILVDQEGKVVSLLARGPLLEVQLRQLLGNPDAK